MKIVVSKREVSEFHFTGHAFEFGSEDQCKAHFKSLEEHDTQDGEFLLELTDNDNIVLDSVQITSELAGQISGGQLN
tara:strand:- start:1409 stop:1639 length:231 start_codon:yes stop_codon:yes gene_type:complete